MEVKVESLCVQVLGHEIVRDVSFNLKSRSTLCLVGESGSGKTTTALSLMGLLSKKRGFRVSGKVLFQEKNLLTLSDRKLRDVRGKSISMIFQDPASSLNPVFTIGDQIAEMFQLHTNMSLEEAETRTLEALDKVGLSDIQNPFETYPHQLSGGMKQRVMIAIALCLEPEVLIADEPTSALDLTVQKEILAQIDAFLGSKLIITHDFGVVAELADDVVVMYAGQIIESGSVYEIFSNPKHPYTKALLHARPTKANRKKMLPTLAGGSL